MKRIIIALTLAVMLLLPTLAMGETTALPFGLSLGMNGEQARAAFAADPVLSQLTPDKSDYGNNNVEYAFEDVAIPGTDVRADELTVQIDQNNSAKADRLSAVSFSVTPVEDSIMAFRKVLEALTATLGAPESDPFGAEAVDSYVEWGTLSASWSLPDTRIALTMNRMYEESLTLQYNSRLNYDKADLGL